MSTVRVVDVQAPQQIADSTFQIHIPPRESRSYRLRGAEVPCRECCSRLMRLSYQGLAQSVTEVLIREVVCRSLDLVQKCVPHFRTPGILSKQIRNRRHTSHKAIRTR